MRKLLFFFISVFTTQHALATHIVYMDISYQWLSGSSYEFTVNLYKDCDASIAAPTSLNISSCSSTGCSTVNIICPQVSGTGSPVFPVCSYPSSSCIGGTDVGFEKYVYKGTGTVSPCASRTFWVTLCCRQPFITTIMNPLSTGMAVSVTMDNLNYPGNSSPVWNQEPLAFVCCGVPYTYDQSATDADGDSLVYSLYSNYSDSPSCNPATLTYNTGYSALNPITSVPPVSINSATGGISMNPTSCSEVGVLGLRVDEYRSGMLVGTSLRDNIVMITPELPTSISETGASSLQVFPNPLSDKTTFSFEGSSGVSFSLFIYDALGKKLEEIRDISGNYIYHRNKLPEGIYFYRALRNHDNYCITGKLIIRD